MNLALKPKIKDEQCLEWILEKCPHRRAEVLKIVNQLRGVEDYAAALIEAGVRLEVKS